MKTKINTQSSSSLSLLVLLGGSGPGNLLLAPGPPGEAQEGHAEAGRLLRPAEEGPGENLPEAEVHQQTGPQETGRETGPEGLPGTTRTGSAGSGPETRFR